LGLTVPYSCGRIVINGIQGFAGAGGSALRGQFSGPWLVASSEGALQLHRTFLKEGLSSSRRRKNVGCYWSLPTAREDAEFCWFYFSIAYGAIAAFLIAKAIQTDQIKGLSLQLKTFLNACAGRFRHSRYAAR